MRFTTMSKQAGGKKEMAMHKLKYIGEQGRRGDIETQANRKPGWDYPLVVWILSGLAWMG